MTDQQDQSRDLALVEDLRGYSSEQSWFEFKKDNIDPEKIGQYCSALSNEARLCGRDFGYLLWGIEDESHAVIGARFDPAGQKVRNQGLEMWLAQMLTPSIAFGFRVIDHPDGRLVLLEIPAATTTPVAFNKQAFIRIGSATPKLADYPDRQAQLIEAIRPYAWESGIAKRFATGDEVLKLLDYPSYFDLTRQPLPENRTGIFERLQADLLIREDVGGHWNITNLGAILFARDLSGFSPALARKAVRFVAYAGRNKAATVTNRLDEQKGYAAGFTGLVGYINNLLPKNEHIGAAFREAQPLFPELAIRELIANALIHQDMTVSGAGPTIELFEDRLEITNPGGSLVPVERIIDLPPRSRNETLASLMRRMGLCEEQGSGLDKVVTQVELFQLPAPAFREFETSFQAILYGPRSFAEMTREERIRACYQHSVLKWLSGDRMKNASLCERLGIDGSKNAAQATQVIKQALEASLIRIADLEHPRAGYVPAWA